MAQQKITKWKKSKNEQMKDMWFKKEVTEISNVDDIIIKTRPPQDKQEPLTFDVGEEHKLFWALRAEYSELVGCKKGDFFRLRFKKKGKCYTMINRVLENSKDGFSYINQHKTMSEKFKEPFSIKKLKNSEVLLYEI